MGLIDVFTTLDVNRDAACSNFFLSLLGKVWMLSFQSPSYSCCFLVTSAKIFKTERRSLPGQKIFGQANATHNSQTMDLCSPTQCKDGCHVNNGKRQINAPFCRTYSRKKYVWHYRVLSCISETTKRTSPVVLKIEMEHSAELIKWLHNYGICQWKAEERLGM